MKEHSSKNIEERVLAERKMIYEMIEASMELAKTKGEHPTRMGCSCIACANRRKDAIFGIPVQWKHRL